jgi:hypothetical protein
MSHKPLKFGSASSFSNSHRFASRCARQHLQRTGWLAADAGGAFEAVAVDVIGEVADEPGVLHAEGGGGELGIQVGDELGDPGLPAQRRRITGTASRSALLSRKNRGSSWLS